MAAGLLDLVPTAVRASVQNVLGALVGGNGPASSSSSTSLQDTADMASSTPSLRTLSKFALSGVGSLFGQSQPVLGALQTCSNPQLSCHNTTVQTNLCCFNAPGGQLLQTQFWDTDPATGPSDSWTIHGLWPDHCDGTFDANCDTSRAYTNITQILQSFGKTDLLSYMNTYWKDYQGNDETFWEHEWGKHGTCISTLNPSCYTNHVPTEEVADFFQKTVDLFKTLPSYTWLAAAGITPSSSTTYTSSAIQSALSAQRSGVTVTLGCSSGALNEIWYHYDVRGSVQTGDFVPTNPDGSKSTCPDTGVKYLPKSGSGTSPTTTGKTTTSAAATGTSAPGTPFSGKGYLNVQYSGATKGCLISAGTWYTSGTCATFTAATSGSGFTLTSSKGKCGVVSGAFTCGSSVSTATTFTAVNGQLAAGGNVAWSADAVASGSTQETVYAGTGHTTGLAVTWQSV